MEIKSLLIDYKTIIKPNMNILGRLFSKIDMIHEKMDCDINEKLEYGLIIVVRKDIYNLLEKLPYGKGRIEYLDTQNFVDAILSYMYIIYAKKRKLCQITELKMFEGGNVFRKYFDEILRCLTYYIPNDVCLFLDFSPDEVDLLNKMRPYIDLGFKNPYAKDVSHCSIFSNKRCEKGCSQRIFIFKNNDMMDDSPLEIDRENIKIFLGQYRNGKKYCSFKGIFSSKAMRYLREMSQMGSTVNKNNSVSQKEIAGLFKVLSIDKEVHVLDVDRKTVVQGEEEGVEMHSGLYSFHSHPREAYQRYGAVFGYPSGQDFMGFLVAVLNSNTVFHAVITVEGIYVLSLSEFFIENMCSVCKNMDKVEKFVLKEYMNMGKKKEILYSSVEEYLNKINGIKYDGENPLFIVQFMGWNDGKEFDVIFKKIDSNCISCMT